MREYHIKTTEDFQRNIQFGSTQESSFFDFKAMVDLKGEKSRQSIAEDFAIDLAAFSNTTGGTLLIGVSEKLNQNGIRVANGICPVQNQDEIKTLLNRDVRDLVHPNIIFETRTIFCSGTILSISVDPSINIIGACLNRDRLAFCFPYRTELGNRYFSFQEVESRMQNSQSRAMYLKLLSYLGNSERAEVTIYPSPLVFGLVNLSVIKLRDNAEEFELLLNSRVIRLPYSIIDEIWNKSNVGQSLCIKLKERIVEKGSDKKLDLDHPLDRATNEMNFSNINSRQNYR